MYLSISRRDSKIYTFNAENSHFLNNVVPGFLFSIRTSSINILLFSVSRGSINRLSNDGVSSLLYRSYSTSPLIFKENTF